MKKLRLLLRRLKSPQVIAGLISEAVVIISLLTAPRQEGTVAPLGAVAASVCSILMLLGILSDPDDGAFGYDSDMRVCSFCGRRTCHAKTESGYICRECGHISGQ